jgi:phosphate transport system permease protein
MELSDREFRKWKETTFEDVDATSIAYSAGGIWPCIVGTALLVVGSMIVALFIGISAAIYERVTAETLALFASSAWQF